MSWKPISLRPCLSSIGPGAHLFTSAASRLPSRWHVSKHRSLWAPFVRRVKSNHVIMTIKSCWENVWMHFVAKVFLLWFFCDQLESIPVQYISALQYCLYCLTPYMTQGCSYERRRERWRLRPLTHLNGRGIYILSLMIGEQLIVTWVK